MTNNTDITRNAIVEALAEVATDNHLLSEGFDLDIAADAILAGEVTADDNDGAITDPALKLAFGAFMSSGRWWVK